MQVTELLLGSFLADEEGSGEWVRFLFWAEALVSKTVSGLQKRACYFAGIAHVFGSVGWPSTM